ncbi:HalD/BesD family halogenase [Pseudomonas zhanjiangensis]|uniref:Fe2OG dioxygenase domain-containing protein n=1 Tax=Pseudomonas zhanjiangensis TaxID=3239015 RepID=A0ABV3YVA8_9PSED
MTSAVTCNTPQITEAMARIIDLDRYPIHELASPKTQALIAQCRKQLDETGCSVVPDFIRPEAVARMRAEAYRLRERTYWSQHSHNPYMTKDDPSLPLDHPKRFFERRTSGFINSDILEADSDLRALYDWDAMTRFVGECVGVWPIYQWADPLARCPYAIMEDGHYFPWHFDGNEFTVSVSVEQPEDGGEFEYVPNMRTLDDERIDDVRSVLQGDRSRVNTLIWLPGALQLFKGRYSLHRVTEVRGKGAWITALPTYVLDPESVNRPERAKQFYGYAMPIHYEREGKRPDRLID